MAQELSWGELLNADVTSESVQMLLRKRLGNEEDADDVQATAASDDPAAHLVGGVSTDDIPWRTLLSSEISRETLGRVMRKPIRLNAKRTERGEDG